MTEKQQIEQNQGLLFDCVTYGWSTYTVDQPMKQMNMALVYFSKFLNKYITNT